MSSLNQSPNSPELVWIIEPENKIRFRYISEGGSHGGLNGKMGKKTFPTLQLKNYHGRKQIVVRVRLFTEDKKEHVLEFKGKKYEGKKLFLEEPLQEDNKVVFKDIKILSKKKDEIEEILMDRRLSNLKDGMSPVVKAQFEKRYRKDVKQRAKAILNSVRLYFEAFEADKPDVPLCYLFSDVICNQKAASKGDLRICRLSQCTGSCKGNDEIILLCEKVQKDNIKVKFFEIDEDGIIIWEDYGIFSPIDVHYQVAIPFKTPPYNKNVEKTVYICLERNEEFSEPREFTYKPDEPSSKKRKLDPCKYETEFSSEKFESGDSISSMSISSPESATADNMPVPFDLPPDDPNLFTSQNGMLFSDDLQEFLQTDWNNDIRTNEDFFSLFENLPDLDNMDGGLDGVKILKENTMIDGVSQFGVNDVIDASTNRNTPKTLILDSIDIDAGVKNLTLKDENEKKSNEFTSDCMKGSLSNLQCKKILRFLLKKDSYGNTLLHIAVLLNQNIMPILKLSQAVNYMNVLINGRNQKNQTALHLATEKNRKGAVRILLKYNSNPNLKDLYGNNCFHIAAKNNLPDVLEEIIKFSHFQHEICDFNNEGLTPVHIAIMQKDPYLFDLLKVHITNVNIVEKRAGRSFLHYAVDFQPIFITKLLEMDGVDVDLQDFEGNTPLHNACAKDNIKAVKELLHSGADPCIKNFKSSFNTLDLENSEDASFGQLPSDLTADIEILQLLKAAEENKKSLKFQEAGNFEKSKGIQCHATERLCEYLDQEARWKKLIPYFLEPDMEDSLSLSPSPSKTLLYYIKKTLQDNYLKELKAVLEMADLKDAAAIINE